MKKQTAVEWLDSNLIHAPYTQEDFNHNYRVFEQAKEMEQELSAEVYKRGFDYSSDYMMKSLSNKQNGIHD
jgi:hypothetical protein